MVLNGKQYEDMKRLCPSCTKEFFPGECDIYGRFSEDGTESPAPDKPIEKFAVKNERERRKAILHPKPLIGPMYTKVDAHRRCPHCGYALPFNIERVRNRNIVIVGDTASGKSHYIAALIYQLEKGMAGREDQHISFDCLTIDVMQKYKEKLDPLFNESTVLAGTKRDEKAEPLIYKLAVRADAEHLPREINLILYDTAGENFVNFKRVRQYSPYLFTADALIFLIDPVIIPEIADRLPTYLCDPNIEQRRTVTTSFNAILSLYRRYHGQSESTGSLTNPIAMTVSKSDLLKYVRTTDEEYHFSHNPVYRGGIDLDDVDIVDKEVKSLLAEYGGISLLHATNLLRRVKYFATSATGYPPQEDGTYPAVEPCRCLDPLLWVLHVLGVIKDTNYIR